MKPLRASPTKPHRLTVERLGEQGEGVGRLLGVEVHVPGAFPLEVAEVVVEAVSRHHPRAHARLTELVTPHPARRESPCPRDASRGGRCTGCPLSALAPAAQREALRATLERAYGLTVDAVVGAGELGYRRSSKRVAFDARHGLTFGSYRRGSHAPAAMEGCLVEHPRIERAFAELEAEARARGAKARGEEGLVLEGAWAKTDGERVLLTLIGSSPPGEEVMELADALTVPGGVHYSKRARGTDALRGEALVHLTGDEALELELAGVRFRSGPLDFLQPNPEVASLAYRALVTGEGRGGLAYDLYAGAGVTTALLRERFARVVPCEAYPESAARLGTAPETAEAFLEAALSRGERPDLVVANPPRGGMGRAVSALISSLAPPELRIMSCSPRSLARDLEELEPTYRRRSVEAFDTLPQTGHVELVVALERRAEA